MTHRIQLFLTAFAYVAGVALSTAVIARHQYVGVFLTAFLVSVLWAGNVRRVAVSGQIDRLIYALGAACGSVSGTFISTLL